MNLPLTYPSDPQQTRAGNILVAEYAKPGKIIEISKQGDIVWEFDKSATTTDATTTTPLNKPSLAIELPNGNILANDDFNHRVIVIDKQTKQIVWQYGVTGKPGDGGSQLNIPDGVDMISIASSAQLFNSGPPSSMQNAATSTSVIAPTTIGTVTRHASQYVGKHMSVRGFVLKKETGYVILSDEAAGSISKYDLPVSGIGEETMQTGAEYRIEGIFLDTGLVASNGNPDHVLLDKAPIPILSY